MTRSRIASFALVFAAGLLAFPVLPLAWDLWRERARAIREKATKTKPAPRILTFADRLMIERRPPPPDFRETRRVHTPYY